MFDDIDASVKKQIVQEKIEQLKIQGYEQELNRKMAESVGNKESMENADAVIANIEILIKTLESEL